MIRYTSIKRAAFAALVGLSVSSVGNHDFASTKHNIYRASLTDKAGHGLHVTATADRHVRAWNEGGTVRWLIADYSNGGNERFLRRISKMDDRPLAIGDPVTGSVNLKWE